MSLLTSLIGTGGGALDPAKSYDGEATVYSGLPDATANTNKIYLVSTDEGVNQAGFYKSNGSTWLYIGHDYDTLDDIPDGTTNKAYTQTEKTKLGSIESNAINSRNSFTQNAGHYIATEGIRARDIGGTALLNDGGTGGVVVYDSGDVDILTKMTASEIKARNLNGLKLHDDGGNGLIVKDGGDVEVDTKVATNIIQAKDANGLRLINDGGSGITVEDNADVRLTTKLLTNKVKAKNSVGLSLHEDGGNGIFIQDGGNVGIGTNSPSSKLHVDGDIRGNRFVDNQNTGRYLDASSTSELGNLVIDNELKIRRTGFRAGSHIAMRYSTYAYPGGGNYNSVQGALEFRAPQGWDSNDLVLTLKSEGFGNNYAQVNGNLSVSGSVSKGSGSFDIPHPIPSKKKTHRLRHYFVETPSAGGNIYKYKTECKEGENLIKLPTYFQYLNKDSLVWVAPFRHFGRAYGEVMGNFAKIVCEKAGTYNILIFGDRKDETAMKDFNKYGIEYEKKRGKQCHSKI